MDVKSSSSQNLNNDNELQQITGITECQNKTTTLGTVVVRGGPVQMVIALLQSSNTIHVKVVEVEPKLTMLGENIDEAVCMLKEFEEILKQLHDMPTPIDEFVAKADKLLVNKKIELDILDAMGHTLNEVWDDILKLFYNRKCVLELCAKFHEKMGSCRGKMASLEVACKDTMIPIEVESVHEFLNKFKQLRIDVLTTVMAALKEGNELLVQLQEIDKLETADLRPGHIKRDAARAISQVQRWLEHLHDRRNLLELAWQKRKGQLEQCLALAILTKDLSELEYELTNKKNNLYGIFSLGSSEHTADTALQENTSLRHDALIFRDRALKITRATEKLISSGEISGDETCIRAYNVLSSCTEYLELIDQRINWSQQSKEFFSKAEKTLSVFERIEIDLSSTKIPTNSSEAFAFFSKILKDVKVFAEESLRLGYNILDEVAENKQLTIETQGIKRVLDEIENRKIYIEKICSSNSEEQQKVSEALKNFQEEHKHLLSWLVSIAETFLKTHNSMGTNLPDAKTFLHLHHQLMQDLEIKGEGINTILSNIKYYLDSLNSQEQYDIDTKTKSLQSHWIELKELVLKRVDVVSMFIEFLEKEQQLSELFENMEKILNESPNESKVKILEDKWSDIKSFYGNLKGVGVRFLNTKISDPYLETKSTCSFVEDILNKYSNRQFDITSSWENWISIITESQKIEILLEKIMAENIEQLHQIQILDTQLYPIFTSNTEDPIKLKDETTQKLQKVLEDVNQTQKEVQKRIESITGVQCKSASADIIEKHEALINNLRSVKSKLDNIEQDYRILLEDGIHFLHNISVVQASIDNYFNENKNKLISPSSLSAAAVAAASSETSIIEKEDHEKSLIQILSDHDHFHEGIMDKFRTLISQSEKLIDRVRVLEPKDAKEHDIQIILKFLENLRINYDTKNDTKMTELKNLQLIKNFYHELSEITSNLNQIHEQLNDIKGQKRKSLSSVKAIYLTFEYFERTIELLDKRIGNFENSYQDVYDKMDSSSKSNAQEKLNELKNKWENLKRDVSDLKKSLKLSVDYFELFEKVTSKNREINSFLGNITNKIPSLRNSVEASNLVNDIEKYISLNEQSQNDYINKLMKFPIKLDNDEEGRRSAVKIESDDLFQSFIKIKSDISSMEERFRNEENKLDEKQRLIEMQNSEKKEQIHVSKIVNETFTEIKYIRPQFIEQLQDTTIKEGEKVVFKCKVIGEPKPIVEWYKDNISIQNNPDYHTTYENNECTLSIDETFTADSARFMCMASNLVGSDETHATLTVQENSIHEQITPPKIVKYLQSGVAQEGGSFQFLCIVTGNPLPTVQWFKDNECIDDSPNYVILYNNGEAILKIDKVEASDAAVYTCKVHNAAGFEQCSAKLTLQAFQPQSEIPKFKLPLSNVMGRVGQKLKLECSVTGIPKPEIFWTHNGKPLTGRCTKYEDDHAVLIIPEAYPKDAGLYVVTARNSAGEVSCSCNVSVKGRLPNETSDSELASDFEPIKPVVQLPLKDVNILEGKPIYLNCVIVGQPEPEVIWYHNNRPVKESDDIQLLFQGDRCSLIIQEAYLEDAGFYKVVAINSAGEASSSCTLDVTPSNVGEPAIREQSQRLSLETPPIFKKFLTDMIANEGDFVEFECSVSGAVPLVAKWYFSNNELQPTSHIKIFSDDNGAFKLRIDKVTLEDRGVYSVTISNKYGNVKCFSRLNVTCIQEQSQTQVKPICPTFKELFSDQNVYPNTTVKFECLVIGCPAPKIQWFFNDQPIPSNDKNFLISTSSGGHQILTIPSANVGMVGKIACVAENDIGKATCVARLNVITDGKQPSTSNIQNISEEHNTGSSRVTITKQMITTNMTSEISSVSDGETSQKPATSNLSTLAQTLDRIEKEIPAQSNPTPESTVQNEMHVKATRKEISPRFINPLIGKIVDQGANVILEAIYDGYPTPEITVKKNGDDLLCSDRIKITNKFNKVSIELLNVGVREAGRYSITATNPAGSSTSTADIVVKKTIFPPVFGRRLQAQVAKRGERVVMEIEVTGTPTPKVSWYKDNKPLEQTLQSKFKIKNEGNIHTLIIEKVGSQDSGKYMVKAVNDGGESQSIADFAVLEPTPERMIEVLKTTVYDDLKDFKKESFKPAEESFHTTKTESKSESDSHSTTESKFVLEHVCRTEATMRLEHKPGNLDLPEISTVTQKQMPVAQTPPIPPPKPQSCFGIKSEDVSKTVSKSEFLSKIQHKPTTVKLPEYTKYNDLINFESEPRNVPTFHKSTEQNYEKTVVIEDSGKNAMPFNLRPGTPPEIGIISPTYEHPSAQELSKTSFSREVRMKTTGNLPFQQSQPSLEKVQPSFYSFPKLSMETETENKSVESETELSGPRSIKDTKKMFENKITEHQLKSESMILKSSNSVKQQTYPKTAQLSSSQPPLIDFQLVPGTPPEICFAPLSSGNEQSLKEDIVDVSIPTIPAVTTKSQPQQQPPPVTKNISFTPTKFEVPLPPPSSAEIIYPEEVVMPNVESRSVKESKHFFESKQSESQFSQPIPQTTSFPKNLSILKTQEKSSPTPMTRNISMTTKQIKINDRQPLVTTDSPAFTKNEFQEYDYCSSDYDEKVYSSIKSYTSDVETEIKGYRPVRPSLTPTSRASNLSDGITSPISPLVFDQLPKSINGLSSVRSNFEPVKKEKLIQTSTRTYNVIKPKPATPQNHPCYTTQYYTAISGVPLHSSCVATEIKNSMEMKKTSETSHKIVNMSQTRRVLDFNDKKFTQYNHEQPTSLTETFKPYFKSSSTPTPTKFIPGDFRESDYESEVEHARIRPLWTPNSSDIDEPRYRHVNPPRPTRATSLPRSYERVISPLEFDHGPPPEKSFKSSTTSQYSTLSPSPQHFNRCYAQTTRDDMNLKVGTTQKYDYHQPRKFGSSFRSKTITTTSPGVGGEGSNFKTMKQHSFQPRFKRASSEDNNTSQLQIYRDESRIKEQGTKHIDPKTGVIYMKYDFGYEFGIIFPGEGKQIFCGSRYPSIDANKRKSFPLSNEFGYRDEIVIPVQHEHTTPNKYGFTATNKRYSMPVKFYNNEYHEDNNKAVTKYPPTRRTASVSPSNFCKDGRPQRPPTFITPLKDIAVVIGQIARFECIVESEPNLDVSWSKNGFKLESSNKHLIEFRNGVCRLTIPETYPDDAGTYSCIATNYLGSTTTSAELIVPGNRCGFRY